MTPPILSNRADFDPAADFDALLKNIPAKPAIYLLADESGQPVQLLSVKNLRYSIKRRLGVPEDTEPSRRVDYRQLVRQIHWRPVWSDFEADWFYLEAAREFFPASYRGMTGLSPAWFIHINPDSNFPRYSKTIDLGIKAGMLLGPLEDKHAAAKLIEETVDWFDLCRYYNILVQAPNGLACAYKEMGKCPAPCDGSISMSQYRHMVRWSAGSLVDPRPLLADVTERMKQAAADLRFESAAKIKQYLDALAKLGKSSFRHVRRLRDFQFVSIQRGPRAGTAKVFLVCPGNIHELAALISDTPSVSGLLRHLLEQTQGTAADQLDEIEAERVGVVAAHLFAAKATSGVFIPLEQLDENALIKAFKEVQKQKRPEPDEQAEGVVKELQRI